jgi:hypothetical protein
LKIWWAVKPDLSKEKGNLKLFYSLLPFALLKELIKNIQLTRALCVYIHILDLSVQT